MKILHISESFEGGVATAVSNYVSVTADVNTEHHLLCSTRTNKLDSGILEKFSTVSYLPKSHFGAIKTVRRVIDKLQPDAVHCHSSFGGVYGRLGGRHFPGLMVYSPHCYAFERLDVSKLVRNAYYGVERFLARYTDVVAACSEREKQLAEAIGGRKGFQVVFVPNISSLTTKRSGRREKIIVGIGRLAPQKDPEAFAEIARSVNAKFIWVGDGEEQYRQILEDVGVEVTGWKSQEEVRKILSSASIYLHTALWEGFPLTILDADKLGLAILARKAPYLVGMPKDGVLPVGELGDEVEKLINDSAARKRNLTEWRKALAENTSEVARERLFGIYRNK